MSFRREAEAAAIAAAAEKQRVSASYIALIPCLIIIILFELTLHDWPFFLTGWICTKCGLTECSIQLQRPYTKSSKFKKPSATLQSGKITFHLLTKRTCGISKPELFWLLPWLSVAILEITLNFCYCSGATKLLEAWLALTIVYKVLKPIHFYCS